MSYKRHSLFPKTLSQCIEPITRPILKKQGLAGSRIISEWPLVVGEKMAAHCIPHKLSFASGKKTDGTLSIAVENGFATELQHLQPIIIERLAVYFGYKAVARIVIAHTYLPPEHRTDDRGQKMKSGYISKDCVEMVKEVEDEGLRTALESLAKKLANGG